MLRTLAGITAPLVLCVAVSPLSCGEIRILAVTTSASFASGLPAPGSLATVFCAGLTGITDVVSASGSPLPGTLAGVRVTFGGGLSVAPILAVADFPGYQQVNFQVPWDAGVNPGPVILSQGSDSAEIPQSAAPWGQFFTDSEGFAIAQHVSAYRLVTRDDPARPGEWIAAYGSNFGNVSMPPPTGFAAPLDRLSPLDSGRDFPWQYSVILQGAGAASVPVSVSYNFIGLAPGMVGVYQINFKTPDSASAPDTQLSLSRSRNCGFFFVPGCGRGYQIEFSGSAKLHVP